MNVGVFARWKGILNSVYVALWPGSRLSPLKVTRRLMSQQRKCVGHCGPSASPHNDQRFLLSAQRLSLTAGEDEPVLQHVSHSLSHCPHPFSFSCIFFNKGSFLKFKNKSLIIDYRGAQGFRFLNTTYARTHTYTPNTHGKKTQTYRNTNKHTTPHRLCCRSFRFVINTIPRKITYAEM